MEVHEEMDPGLSSAGSQMDMFFHAKFIYKPMILVCQIIYYYTRALHCHFTQEEKIITYCRNSIWDSSLVFASIVCTTYLLNNMHAQPVTEGGQEK